MAKAPVRPRANGNGHANGHGGQEGNGVLLSAAADPGQSVPPGYAPKRRVAVPPALAAWAKRKNDKPGSDRIRPPRTGKPFELAHSAFPPVVLEALKLAKTSTMAMDDALTETAAWASESLGVYAEGTAFLGYAFLATLAQRPEFRVASEEIAGEMTREWIEIKSKGGTSNKNDKIKIIQDDMESFKLQEVFRDAAESDGLMGRGHIFIDLGDVEDRDELKTSIGNGSDQISKLKVTKGSLKGFKTVEATWCYPNNYNSNDPLADDWYNPRSWVVMAKEVHRTRFLTIIGRKVPDMLKPAYAFGGLSLSQMMMPYVDNWLRTRQSVADLLEAFSLMVLGTAMDADMGNDNADLFGRVDFFNNTRNNRGMIVIDKETEEVSNVAAPLGTLDALQAQSQEHMASISRIPIVKLLGIQPAGLNASSEGEIRSFYDWIHSFQEKLFREPLTTCLNFIQLNRFGEVDPDITFVFRDLWQIDDAQEASVQQTWAATHEAYLGMGVVQPEDIRKTLTADPDSPYAGIELEELPAPPQPDLSSLGVGGPGGAPGAGPPQPGAPPMHQGGAAGGGTTSGPVPQASPPPQHSFKQPVHPKGSSGQSPAGGVTVAKPGGDMGGIRLSHVNPGHDAMLQAGALDWEAFDAPWKEEQHRRGQPKNKGQFVKGSGGGGSQKPQEASGGGGTPPAAPRAPAAQVPTHTPPKPFAVSAASGITPAVRQAVLATTSEAWGLLNKTQATSVARTVCEAMGYDKSKVTIRTDAPKTFVLNGKRHNSGGEANRITGEINLWPSGFTPKGFPGAVAHEIMHQKWQTAANALKAGDPTATQRIGPFVTPEGIQSLIANDGVTPYSREYWMSAMAGKTPVTIAIHETLAEMARLDMQGGLINRNHDVHEPWVGLYNAINDIHPAVKDQYAPRRSGNQLQQAAQPQPSQPEQSTVNLLQMAAPVSHERFMQGQPPDLAPRIAEAEARLKAGTPTSASVSEGGHRLPDGSWTPERQKVHADIVKQNLSPAAVSNAAPAPGQQPTMTVLGGRNGSGKSWLASVKSTHPGKGYSAEAKVVDGVIQTGNVEDAVRAIWEGRKVELSQPRQLSTLVTRLGDIAQRMEKMGGKTPNFDLCNVTVAGTNLFCAQTLGIPRIKMPQLPEDQTQAFQDYLSKQGFTATAEEESPAYLKATQNELVGAKIAGIMQWFRTRDASLDPPLFVSKDNYVVDGHHRWAARVGLDAENNTLGDTKVKIIRVNIPITELLQQAETFTGGRGHKAATAHDAALAGGGGALVLDTDAIKRMLPEYQGWNAPLLHEEASDIADQIDEAARGLGINIIHDGTLRHYEPVRRKIKAYKDAGYRIEGHFMFAPPELAAHRAMSRFMQPGGRYVPPQHILGETGHEASFDALRPEFDDWSIHSNVVENGEPQLASQGQPP